MPSTGKWKAGVGGATATVAAVVLLAAAPVTWADPPQTGGPAPPAAPSSPPTVSGTELDGETLTGTNGDWGLFPPSFSYEWFRCDDAAGNVCDDAPVAGRTAITYLLGPADVGRRLKLRVRGTTLTGFREVDSQPTGVIQAIPPANTALPAISGTPRRGQTLNSTDGSWSGTAPISFTRQWVRCDAGGANCSNISGATGSSYTAADADLGSTLRVRITADNAAPGTVSQLSDATAQVDGIPVNQTAPQVTGSALRGETLSATNGSWSAFPAPTFSYQWVRCDGAGANCADVAGATGATYVLGPADDGMRLRVRVTATNSVGSTAHESGLTSAVVAPPENTAPPTVTGTPKVGQTLNGDDGDWTGTPAPTFAYLWFRCDASGAGCAPISGATSLNYLLRSADAGRRLKLRVTANNPAPGTVAAVSAPTAVVDGPPAASFSFRPALPVAGREVDFTAASSDPDGGAVALDWDLDNDGAFDDASGATASRVFATAGTRTVRLRAVDDETNTVIARRSFTVYEPPAEPAPSEPVPPAEPASPAFDLPGPTPPTPEPARPALIRPFPVIRIAGRATRRGARIRLLAVRAPRGSLVRVRCKGGKRRGCKYRRARKRVGRRGRTRIRGLERRLRARTVIEVLVTRPGEIGKFTRFRIRRRKAPARRDRCLMPGSTKPVSCKGLR